MSDRIDSPQNPRVKRLVRLRKPRERREAGVILVEGVRELERAVAAGAKVMEVWWSGELLESAVVESALSASSALPLARLGELGVEVSAAVMRKVAVMREPEGVLGVVRAPDWEWGDVPDAWSSPEGAAQCRRVLVAAGCEKPGNLGAMVRSAEAAGFDAVVAAGSGGGGGVDIFNPSAVRNSTGAVFSTPVVAEPDEELAAEKLRERGYKLVAAVAEAGDSPQTLDWPDACAIVIGPEHDGLSERWLECSDLRVTIPMQGRVVDSLNASVAAGVLCFASNWPRMHL